MSTRNWKSVALAVAAAFLFSTSGVRGATIYDNGAPNLLGGNQMSAFNQADDFINAFLSNLTGIRFYHFEISGTDYNGSITWEILNDSSGSPGSSIASGNTSTVTTTFLGTVTLGDIMYNRYQDDFSIAAAGLGAGTYWLALHNGLISQDLDTDYFWEWAALNATTPGQEFDLFAGGAWATNDSEHAFQVFGDSVGDAIPEPGTLLLLGAGLVGLGGFRRNFGDRRDHV